MAGVLLARLLGKEDFGRFGLLQASLGALGALAGVGLNVTATRYVASLRTSDHARLGRVLGGARIVGIISPCLFALGFYLSSGWVATQLFDQPLLTPSFQVLSIALVFYAVSTVQQGVLAGFAQFRRIATINVISSALILISYAVGALAGGLYGVAWAISIAAAFTSTLNHLAIRHQLRLNDIEVSFRAAFYERNLLWKSCLPAALASAVVGPTTWLCSALLARSQGGVAEVGIYHVALQWGAVVLFAPGALHTVILPILSELQGLRDKGQHDRLLKVNLLLNFFTATIIGIPILLFADLILVAYGSEFSHGSTALRLVVVASILMAINNVVGSTIAAADRMWVGLIFNVMWASVLLAGTYAWAQLGGAAGLAAASILAYTAHTIWQFSYVRLFLKVRI